MVKGQHEGDTRWSALPDGQGATWGWRQTALKSFQAPSRTIIFRMLVSEVQLPMAVGNEASKLVDHTTGGRVEVPDGSLSWMATNEAPQ